MLVENYCLLSEKLHVNMFASCFFQFCIWRICMWEQGLSYCCRSGVGKRGAEKARGGLKKLTLQVQKK
jgi:hypothetical protein